MYRLLGMAFDFAWKNSQIGRSGSAHLGAVALELRRSLAERCITWNKN